MFQYLVRRLLVMIPTLTAISIVSFILIQLPPGDYLTTYAATLATWFGVSAADLPTVLPNVTRFATATTAGLGFL